MDKGASVIRSTFTARILLGAAALAAGVCVLSSAATQLGGGVDPLLVSLQMGSGEDAMGTGALSPEAAAKLMARSTLNLQRSPMSVEDIRNAGLAAEALGKPAEARAAMALAGNLSWRDSATQLWLFSQAVREQDFVEAVGRADALMRRDKLVEQVMPLIYILGADDTSRAALIERLAKNPHWRGSFFALARRMEASVDPFRAIVSDLAATDFPATDEELAPMLKGLIDARQYGSARDIWLAGHPRARNRFSSTRYVEGFEDTTTGDKGRGTTFGWSLAGSPGVTLEPKPGSSSGRDVTLRIAPLGIESRTIGSALLILEPGVYTFSVETMPAADPGAFRWDVSCLPARQALADTGPVSSPAGDWTLLSWTVTIPAGNCAAQRFSLSVNGGGSAGNGPLLVDNLRVGKKTQG